MGHIKGRNTVRGMSLVDVIVGVAIMSIVFLALVSSFNAAAELGTRNRLRANALLLANDHLETIRALPFDAIGTVAGIPSGTIPQLEMITYDNKAYARRTSIQYVDDDADQLASTPSPDTDLNAADYKRVKVELSYSYRGATTSFALVTTVAPKSQEALAGAGVLQIKVYDADNQPVHLASVHVVNNTMATSVDATYITNPSGVVSIPGAWAGNGYTITVDKAGFSHEQTYDVTGANPSPSPGHANVIEAEIMELIFKIDLLSQLTVRTRQVPVRERFLDSFDDTAFVAATASAEVAGGALLLAGAPGSYASVGTGTSATVAPVSLGSWLMLTWDDTEPVGTEVRYHVYYENGADFVLVPESALTGNEMGYTAAPVDIGVLNPTTYPSLRLVAVLTSSDTSVTPAINEWKLSYFPADVPEPNVSFSLRGQKTIGTSPVVYKYDQSHITNGSGIWSDAFMEWDEYLLTLTSPGYTVAETCPSPPIALAPGTTYEQVLTLAPAGGNALRILVQDPLGQVVPRAEVHVTGPAGYDTVFATSKCGIAYVAGLAGGDYSVSVTAAGFAVHTDPLVPVNGVTDLSVGLSY